MSSVKQIEILEFISEAQNGYILDARSEGEHEQGHIPDSISFPLLKNDERVQVGTCYKQKGNLDGPASRFFRLFCLFKLKKLI